MQHGKFWDVRDLISSHWRSSESKHAAIKVCNVYICLSVAAFCPDDNGTIVMIQ